MNTYSLPLFPLNVVIFPEGLLPLKIFEARYLDMVRACLRNKTAFGVVAVNPESNLQQENKFPFAEVGTSFKIIEADVPQPGLMTISCLGAQRFRVNSVSQQEDSLWLGQVEDIEPDIDMKIPDDLQITAVYLQRLIDSLSRQDDTEQKLPIAKPFKLDDCAWVANRWCELLDIPLIQKQRMLELDSPLLRLELVQDILNSEFSSK